MYGLQQFAEPEEQGNRMLERPLTRRVPTMLVAVLLAACGESPGPSGQRVGLMQIVSAGGNHTCGVTVAGAAYCWGYNEYGQLGDGTTTTTLSPVLVAGGVSFAAVSAGGYHTCGVTAAGAAYCWGHNGVGQLGDGTLTNRSSPVLVAGGVSFAAVSAGGQHTCGVTAAGAAYCWGFNGIGQLGDGTLTNRSSPVLVAGGVSFATVSAGGGHACGVTAAGAAYCWGYNRWGQLGVGTTTGPEMCTLPCSTVPVLVVGGVSFAAVSAGGQHTCGVTAAAYCWGINGTGQLGDGTRTGRSSPVLVAGGVSFAAVSAGVNHTCGVTAAGAAYCWGYNEYGQLGVGTTTGPETCITDGHYPCSTVPVLVVGGVSFAAVSAGGNNHSCGVTAAGAAYCWGSNSSGELGDGTTSTRSSPVLVAGSGP
jgi:alpha-tubulin suppressor-like RCC1 family protein